MKSIVLIDFIIIVKIAHGIPIWLTFNESLRRFVSIIYEERRKSLRRAMCRYLHFGGWGNGKYAQIRDDEGMAVET
jgi:hypothetical protein